jgi:hypothetical protein
MKDSSFADIQITGWSATILAFKNLSTITATAICFDNVPFHA